MSRPISRCHWMSQVSPPGAGSLKAAPTAPRGGLSHDCTTVTTGRSTPGMLPTRTHSVSDRPSPPPCRHCGPPRRSPARPRCRRSPSGALHDLFVVWQSQLWRIVIRAGPSVRLGDVLHLRVGRVGTAMPDSTAGSPVGVPPTAPARAAAMQADRTAKWFAISPRCARPAEAGPVRIAPRSSPADHLAHRPRGCSTSGSCREHRSSVSAGRRCSPGPRHAAAQRASQPRSCARRSAP